MKFILISLLTFVLHINYLYALYVLDRSKGINSPDSTCKEKYSKEVKRLKGCANLIRKINHLKRQRGIACNAYQNLSYRCNQEIKEKLDPKFKTAIDHCQVLKAKVKSSCEDNLQQYQTASAIRTSISKPVNSIGKSCDEIKKSLKNINANVKQISSECSQDAHSCKDLCGQAIQHAARALHQTCSFNVTQNLSSQNLNCDASLMQQYQTAYNNLLSFIHSCDKAGSQAAGMLNDISKKLEQKSLNAESCVKTATDKAASFNAQNEDTQGSSANIDAHTDLGSESLASYNKKVEKIGDIYVKKSLTEDIAATGSKRQAAASSLVVPTNGSSLASSLSGNNEAYKHGKVQVSQNNTESNHQVNSKSGFKHKAEILAAKEASSEPLKPSQINKIADSKKWGGAELMKDANGSSKANANSSGKYKNNRSPSSVKSHKTRWNNKATKNALGMYTRKYAPPSANIFDLISSRIQSLCRRKIIESCWD